MNILPKTFAVAALLATGLVAAGCESEEPSRKDLGPLEALRVSEKVERYDKAFWNGMREKDPSLLKAAGVFCEGVYRKKKTFSETPNCGPVIEPVRALLSGEREAPKVFTPESLGF